jgi:HAD superfamily hydrolase (TIGR01509 family)
MIRAVVFDCDGVLVDSEPLAAEAWRRVLVRHGYTLTDEDVEFCRGLTVTDMYPYLAARADLPDFEELLADVDAVRTPLYAEHLTAFPDAVATVQALALGGVPLAVASSSRRRLLIEKLERFDLMRYFAAIVGGDEVERGKPDPGVFLAAAERLGVIPKECLVIEDAASGAEAAVAAGMRVVIVHRGGELVAGHASVSTIDATLIRSWMGLG